MEVVLQLRKYSFYTSSETTYIQETVLIKKEIPAPKKKEHYFHDIKKESKLNLKFECSDPEKLRILLTERVVKIRSQDIVPLDQSKSITFIIEDILPCEI